MLFSTKAIQSCEIVFAVSHSSVILCFCSKQGFLNSSMDSLKAELNTALQCDKEAEEEVKKLKVGLNTSIKKYFKYLQHYEF